MKLLRPRSIIPALLVIAPLTSAAWSQTTQPAATRAVSYKRAFRDLYDHLGKRYAAFALKGIDWKAVGRELLPEAAGVKTDEEFGLLCMKLVARLEDSHASLLPGSAQVPHPPLPQWYPGLACLIDNNNQPAVYYLEPNSPAAKAGVKIGEIIVSVDDRPAAEAMQEWMRLHRTYAGYSSHRALRYNAARYFLCRQKRGERIRLKTTDPAGGTHTYELAADRSPRYLPRLPVPIKDIPDSRDCSWTRLAGDIGYIYVRRIRGDLLPATLDKAVGALQGVRGLIIDVRGNSGGGFQRAPAVRNFNLDDGAEPLRPRYAGPIALLIDEHCVSAGEGWASWFVASKRACLFGTATTGASSSKETYTLTNGLYKVIFSVGLRRGPSRRPIEHVGLEPDVPVRQSAADLAAGRDTVLEAARQYLFTTRPAE